MRLLGDYWRLFAKREERETTERGHISVCTAIAICSEVESGRREGQRRAGKGLSGGTLIFEAKRVMGNEEGRGGGETQEVEAAML